MQDSPAMITSLPYSTVVGNLGFLSQQKPLAPCSEFQRAVGKLMDARSLLVVDDSPRARMALTAFLALRDDIKIIGQASNGLEAVNFLMDHMPDVILMDMKMPVMDGLEATRIIKRSHPNIRVVILSMYSDYVEEAFSCGADDFLVKGCSMAELMSAVSGSSEVLDT